MDENKRLFFPSVSFLPVCSVSQFFFSKRSILLISMLLGILSGCSTLDRMSTLNDTGNTGIDAQEIAQFASNQEEVYQSLVMLAGLPSQPVSPDEWSQLIMAGVQYSNQKCENYLDALQWSKSGRQVDSSLLGQGSNFTNSVMGIAKASARELALTAAAFGYTRSSFDALSSDRLAGLEPSTIRKVVRESQQAYMQRLNTNQYTNRIGAFNALQGYIRLCLPSSIEAQSNSAVRGAKAVSRSSGGINTAPYVSFEADTQLGGTLQ